MRLQLRDARVAIAVLAAGSSRRFGDADKLTAPFRGAMLGEHACAAIPKGLFTHKWVIASGEEHGCAESWRASGFDVIRNPNAHKGMGTSVALAAHLALKAGCDALLIALADMPLVPADHFRALVQRIVERGVHGVVVSQAEATRMPPAAFGAEHLERLARLGGDTGARAILGEGEVIACSPQWLVDIDTPETLSRLS